MKRDHLYLILLLVAAVVAMYGGVAWAYASPVPGDMGYDIYDRIHKIQSGGIGATIAMGLVGMCVYAMSSNHIPGIVTSLLAAGVLVKADTIVTTLGSIF